MRLSDFKDEKAVEVVAKLMIPIGNITSDMEMGAKQKSAKHMGEFVSVLLQRHRRDVMDMLAILADVEPADYHCTAATVMVDVLNMMSDPEMMELFGLQRQTSASSGSASESTEAPVQPPRSSNMPARGSGGNRKRRRTKHT